MMSEIKRYVFKAIFQIFSLFNQVTNCFAEESFVLSLGSEFLAGELDEGFRGVVPGAS